MAAQHPITRRGFVTTIGVTGAAALAGNVAPAADSTGTHALEMPLVTAREAAMRVKVMEAMYLSARQRKWVTVQ